MALSPSSGNSALQAATSWGCCSSWWAPSPVPVSLFFRGKDIWVGDLFVISVMPISLLQLEAEEFLDVVGTPPVASGTRLGSTKEVGSVLSGGDLMGFRAVLGEKLRGLQACSSVGLRSSVKKGLIFSWKGDTGSELVALPGVWDWLPDSPSFLSRLSLSLLISTDSIREVLLSRHSDSAWGGLHWKDMGSKSRLATPMSGGLRSTSSEERGEMRAGTWISPSSPSLSSWGRLS